MTQLRLHTAIYNFKNRGNAEQPPSERKYLYASPVGRDGKKWLPKIIRKFGHDHFDYLLFSYDDADFSEEIFRNCRIVREKGFKWDFANKYLTPEVCGHYDYIFFWDDDVDIDSFNYIHFIKIMQRNNLECAHPALTPDSDSPHALNLKNPRYPVGRLTDFVEIMAPVFTKDAWIRYWKMVSSDCHSWGWGYPVIGKSFCKFSNTGIIDCETVRHARPYHNWGPDNPPEMELRAFLQRHKQYKQAKKLVYGSLQKEKEKR